MKKLLFLFFLSSSAVFLDSCSDSGSNDPLTFTNDMESQFAWNENRPGNLVYFKNAHSGSYVCIIDSINIFSSTFNMNLKDISPAPLRRVTVGAWLNVQQAGAEPQIAIDIRDKDGTTLDWIAYNAKEKLKNTGEWYWAEMSVDLMAKGRNTTTNTLRIYVFNKSIASCLVDDIKIRFEQ